MDEFKNYLFTLARKSLGAPGLTGSTSYVNDDAAAAYAKQLIAALSRGVSGK